ncbi:MAG: amidase family protein, partial [Rhodospirillales bacterium]|nr:amidase family protein [Rhodospirillales bacterium]
MTNDLCFTPATELASLIRREELSPVELIDAVLARVEACEPRINAFSTLTAERAREAAQRAETALTKGDAEGALFGLPVTIKDLTETAGIPTERGSHSLKGHVPTVDAPVIPRLEEAGAIILGKTTTSEFGWSGVSNSPLTGITSNPWREGYSTGASSAGAGAAAAAGYGPLHQGSDGAGSIRMPSHFSGIFGLKPTYGRVPNWPVPNNDQVSHVGPMTRTVGDSALMLQAMAGPHPWDHTSLEAPPADYPARLDDGIAGLKVAFSPDLGHARVDTDVAALVQSAAEAFQSLGCTVESPALPFGPEGPEIIRLLWPIHLHAYRPLLDEFEDRMDPGLVACIRAADGVTGATYLETRARKLAYVEAVHRFFEEWDLLLTPAVSVAAFPAERLQP